MMFKEIVMDINKTQHMALGEKQMSSEQKDDQDNDEENINI